MLKGSYPALLDCYLADPFLVKFVETLSKTSQLSWVSIGGSMNTVELLAKFADPEIIKTLSLSEKLIAGLVVTFLGMGITLISLVILQIAIAVMARLTAGTPVPATNVIPREDSKDEVINDEEIVAAVTAAIALQLKTSVSNIIIRNIEKIEEPSSAWQKAGIAEQLNNKL